MQCDKCGKSTKINWGNAKIVLCEQCYDSFSGDESLINQISSQNQFSPSKENYAITQNKYNKVGGWLLFLCFNLVVFNPLTTMLTFFFTFNDSKSYFNKFSGLETITYIDIVLSIGLMIFSVYAGLALWKIKKNAVKITKVYLTTFLVYTFITNILFTIVIIPESTLGIKIFLIIKESLRSIIIFIIWFSYLTKSKRVLNTYSLNNNDIY